MKRANAATLACAALVGLTLLTWQLAEQDASAGALAAVALVKVGVVGGVFLELDRARPIWGALFLASLGSVLGGAAWLIGG